MLLHIIKKRARVGTKREEEKRQREEQNGKRNCFKMEKREELILVVEMNRESPLCVLLHNVMAVVLVMEIRSGFCCATEFKQRTTTRIWRSNQQQQLNNNNGGVTFEQNNLQLQPIINNNNNGGEVGQDNRSK
uniref:Candidate secreted effector n=1 Tax=Meloidogyne incognita TaxID=6306 RepID=A0A914KSN4_MELIC